MNCVAKAFAATGIAELLTTGTTEAIATERYLEKLDVSPKALSEYRGDAPGQELLGLDECLAEIAKVHPSPGGASSVREEIMSRIHPEEYDKLPNGTVRKKSSSKKTPKTGTATDVQAVAPEMVSARRLAIRGIPAELCPEEPGDDAEDGDDATVDEQ